MNHIAFITGPADFLNLYSFLQEHRMQDDTIAIVLFGTAHNVSKDLKEATQKLSRPLDNASFYFLDSDDESLDGLLSLREEVSIAGSVLTNLFITHVFGVYENLILDTFAYERLILIENGLATYHPPIGRDPRLR